MTSGRMCGGVPPSEASSACVIKIPNERFVDIDLLTSQYFAFLFSLFYQSLPMVASGVPRKEFGDCPMVSTALLWDTALDLPPIPPTKKHAAA
jgi:hypothetical protein